MAVTNNFSSSSLDLNGVVNLKQPTALVWGPDGRLYVTEVDGDVKVLTVEFGDKTPGDGDNTAQFFVTGAVSVSAVKDVPNHADATGLPVDLDNRQVTGIDVTPQHDADGVPMLLADGTPMVTMYVTSSDSRIGAGGDGDDAGLDTNSGVLTKLTQTGPDSWTAIDLVRGLARSEENHALNGLEVIQTLDDAGNLVSERLIVANGGNANSGAPSNNFAGQQEQPLSGAILEIDLDMLKAMEVQIDAGTGRAYVYDAPTLDDPTRPGDDATDPWGGNDGLNSAKFVDGGPVKMYSPGYRNSYDVEVTEDGRVFTYDNGANDDWGGRPIGEAGDNGKTNDFDQAPGYISTNLNNGEGNGNDDINLVAWKPFNKDQLHEVTRSDDLAGRFLSAGQGGATLYSDPVTGHTYVYGGHPNPTRAEGSRAGLLFSPKDGAQDAFLLVSNQDSYGNGGGSDYDEVVAWLAEVEADDAKYPTEGIYGADPGELTSRVLAVTPGVEYDIYSFSDGTGAAVPAGGAVPSRAIGGTTEDGVLLGQSGLPSDIAEIVARVNPIEGDYLEAGKTDGAVDTGNGSINGMTEYTSTVFDDGTTKMSGALIAASLNQGSLVVIGRAENGSVPTTVKGGFTIAADRTVIDASGAPLGLASLGDDYEERGLTKAFQGSIWTTVYKQNGPFIEVLQPQAGGVPLAGTELTDPTDADGDGVNYIQDPFEFSQENGYDLGVGQALVLDFSPLNDDFPSSFSSTGLLGAALDGSTPNQDAQTEAENYPVDQQRDGLFDSGANLIPGGNAPLFQIKEVVDGTMVGAGNGVRDAMQTGFKPEADVQRVVSTVSLKNWLPGVVPQVGQLAGMFFGDGTQANFLRAVFGGIEGVGIGLEVGYELNDADYTVLARIPLPTLGLLEGAPETVELRLEIAGLLDGLFDVLVGYKLGEDAGFTNVPLLGGAGFSLPSGVLQDVLTGEHTIPSGAGPQVSGAAVGFVAEDVPGGDLASIDVQEITIEGFGNDILADTGSEVGKSGTSGVDTVIYTGSDTNLAPLASNVENFDGRGSSADYAVAGNALDNVFQMGVGANTVTTGKGSDTVRGTLDQLAGDEITDFGKNDEVIVEGVSAEDATVTYADGSAIVTVNGQSITFSGPEFASFQAAEGPTTFALEDVADGLRITLVPDEAVVYRVNAGSSVGGAGQGTIAAIDGGPDWIGDAGLINSAGPVSLTGATNNAYKDASSDEESEIGYTAGVDEGVVPWQVFVSERSDNNAGGAKITYNFEVEVGATYRIDLFYAEGWSGIFTSSEERQFDVSVEGSMPSAFQDLSPLEEAAAALGIAVPGAGSSQADKDAVLGTALVRSHTMTAGDETLTLQFLHETQNPKVNAIQITQLGGLPVDSTPPEIVSIEVENPQSVQDDPRKATVVLSDERGFDEAAFDGLDGSELTFTGIVPDGVSTPVVSLSDEGKTATLTYTLTPPSAGWPKGEGQLSIAAGAYADAAGNATAAASGTFILEPNLGSLQPGALALAINVGPTSNTTDAALEGSDKQTYGGAIALDPILGIALEADDPSYYAPSSKTGSNIDGKAGPTGSNPALDGSALHTYRDSADGSFTATYPIANGVYVVELWFAELFHDQAGNRQGDYAINGELVELDFDAFTAAGGADTPVKISQAVTVTNGEIVVEVNADTGQPGFNAIVVYEAIEAGGAPVVSVGDVSAVEGGEALVAFTRIGDTTEPVEVTFSLTPGGADATDYSTPLSTTVTIPAGQSTAVVPVSIVDDALEEGAETFTVTIDSVSGGGATIGDATGTVTIAASDVSSDTPAGSAVFALDFETAGDPLAQGGFDGLLGGAGALQAAKASVSGGKLQVATSDGDLSQTSATASKNDFVKAADISAASIQTAFLQTRFDNPFDQAFLADRGLGETVPNYLQQGIVIATGDSGSNQNANQFLKLIWGGGAGHRDPALVAGHRGRQDPARGHLRRRGRGRAGPRSRPPTWRRSI